jgi:hypothetical protein
MKIVRCISCEGYGWFEEDGGRAADCDWCGGVGYVYRDDSGVDHHIPEVDYGKVANQLEQLEIQRLREMGYTGQPRKPWEQAIRRNK